MAQIVQFPDRSLVTPEAAELVRRGLFDAAVQLMDDEIREMVHEDLSPCTEDEFLSEYMRRHEQKYGAAFIVF